MTDNLLQMLDSMTGTGIYVITQDTHQILYYNKRVKEVAPNIAVGMVCHELWEGTCENCPLLCIEGRSSSHTINYGDPFGEVVDLSASRMLWDAKTPAYVVTVSEHRMSADEARAQREVMQLAKAAAGVYSRIYSANLTKNTCQTLGYETVTSRRLEKSESFDERLSYDLERIHPKDVETYRERFSRQNLLDAFKSGVRDIQMQYRMRTEEDTDWHWFSTCAIPVENPADDDILEVVMVRDIDEEKKREDRYRNYMQEQNEGSRKLLQMALADTSIYEFYYYPLEKRIVNSRRLVEKFGTPLDLERIPEYLTEMFIGPKYAQNVLYIFDSVLKGKENAASVFETVDGQYWVRMKLSTVSVNEQGAPTYVVGTLEDITKEKEHEKKLRSLEQRNEEILLSVNSLYFAINSVDLETGRIQFIRTFGDIQKLGIKNLSDYTEVLHRTAAELYAPEDGERMERDFHIDRLKECSSTGQDRFYGEYRRKIGEEWRWISCTAYFMNRESGHRTVILALQDIHEQHIRRETEREEEIRKERETGQLLKDALNRAEQASKAKSDFLSRMSHDIRTPMNAIVGMTALAENYIDSREKVRECIAKINISSQHMMELINEVLDMSKIESGTLDLTRIRFALPEMIESTVTMLRPSIEKKGQELIVDAERIKHENVEGDRLRLQQVFNNILSNACKYTPEGGTLHFTAEELASGSEQEGCFRFIFKDTGIGIDESFLPHLFEPFARAADSRTSKVSGTGLGLAITSNIVQMMGGEIRVESKKEEGTVFTVTVPLLLAGEEQTEYEELKGKSVLIADDEEVCRNSLKEIVTGLGMECDLADSGEDALILIKNRLSRKETYHTVILDWAMPGLDGVEAAEAIRRLPGTEDTVLVLCAYDWSSIEHDALKAGVDRYLQKPLSRARIRALFVELADREKGTEEKRNLEGKRILLVEDNELNMEIASEMLKIIGVSYETAEDGEKAVECFERNSEGYYDLIFMDIRMPVMDGYEATKKIRRSARADAPSIPIIAMTADAFSDDVRKALDAGMNEHLSKPIDIEGITKVLNRWL